MKKFILLLAIVSLVSSTGCKEDDTADALKGTWVAEAIVVTGCQEEARNGREELECNDSCYRLELNGSGEYTFQRGFTTETGFWDAGSKLKLCMDQEGEVVCEEYGIDFAQNNLILSTDSTSSGCVTSYIFAPEVVDDTSEEE